MFLFDIRLTMFHSKIKRYERTIKTTPRHVVECYDAFFPFFAHKKKYMKKDAHGKIPSGNARLNEGIKAAEERLWFFIILHLLFEIRARDSTAEVMPRS